MINVVALTERERKVVWYALRKLDEEREQQTRGGLPQLRVEWDDADGPFPEAEEVSRLCHLITGLY